MCEEIVTYARGAKVAGGRDPEAQFGPVQNKAQYDKVLSYLEGARASGQNIAGGDVPKGPGYFVPLTAARDVEDGYDIVDEGPCVRTLPFRTAARRVGQEGGC